jgi:hypothetical protein
MLKKLSNSGQPNAGKVFYMSAIVVGIVGSIAMTIWFLSDFDRGEAATTIMFSVIGAGLLCLAVSGATYLYGKSQNLFVTVANIAGSSLLYIFMLTKLLAPVTRYSGYYQDSMPIRSESVFMTLAVYTISFAIISILLTLKNNDKVLTGSIYLSIFFVLVFGGLMIDQLLSTSYPTSSQETWVQLLGASLILGIGSIISTLGLYKYKQISK